MGEQHLDEGASAGRVTEPATSEPPEPCSLVNAPEALARARAVAPGRAPDFSLSTSR